MLKIANHKIIALAKQYRVLVSLLITLFISLLFVALLEKILIKPHTVENLNYSANKRNFVSKLLTANLTNTPYVSKFNFSFQITNRPAKGTLFSTSNKQQGIRIAIYRGENLVLVTHKQGLANVSPLAYLDDLGDESHKIQIKVKNNKISLKLNGKNIPIKKPFKELDFSNLTIGYGTSLAEYFSGNIEEFSAEYYPSSAFSFTIEILKQIILALTILLLLIILLKIISNYKRLQMIFLSIVAIISSLIVIYSFRAINSFYDLMDHGFGNQHYVIEKLNSELFFFFLKNEIKKDFIFITAKKLEADDTIDSFYITINQEYLDKLDSNLPESGKEEYPAYLKINDEPIQKAKIRYRGQSPYHWFFTKKSLKVKLQKGNSYRMERKFNLVTPPFIISSADVAHYQVARDLGLISPEYFPVRVFVNGEYMGLYHFLSQPDESLLRKHKRMPGSIYSGEFAEAPESTYEYPALWKDPNMWLKKASRNAEQKNNREDINFLLDKINNSSQLEFYNFFRQFINIDAFYNYTSLDRLVGAFHHDALHNHRIYFDPYKGKFEPIEWDLRYWFWSLDDSKNHKDMNDYALLRKVKFNPILEYELDKLTYEIMQTNILDEISAIYYDAIASNKNSIEADKYKTSYDYWQFNFQKESSRIFPYSDPVTYRDYIKKFQDEQPTLKNRHNFLLTHFSDSKVKYKLVSINKDRTYLKYSIGGNSPVKINFSDLGHPIRRYHNNKENRNQQVNDILYPGRLLTDRVHYTITSFQSKEEVFNANQEYIYIIDAGIEEINIEKIHYVNAITNQQVTPYPSKEFDINANSIHPWDIPEPRNKTIILEGTIHVTKDLEYQEYEEVIIKAGTTFIISPQTSILFAGKVTAIGTPSARIKFTGQNMQEPWGAVIVQGKETSNSVFRYVDFDGGSITSKNLIHYTAQFNIHDNDNFEISNCTFKNNKIGDDNVHIAYANGTLENSLFFNSNADALDVDIADVKVANNKFINSGNDAIDLMTSKAKLDRNIIDNAGDKGVSVGEWSIVAANDNIIKNSYLGIAVKDKSEITLNNILFIDTKKTILEAYRKNWRYDDGGKISGDNIFALGNNQIHHDQDSTINVEIETQADVPEEFLWSQEL